jgi:hypothetical protein
LPFPGAGVSDSVLPGVVRSHTLWVDAQSCALQPRRDRMVHADAFFDARLLLPPRPHRAAASVGLTIRLAGVGWPMPLAAQDESG